MFFNGCQQKPGNKKEIEKKRLESIKQIIQLTDIIDYLGLLVESLHLRYCLVDSWINADPCKGTYYDAKNNLF